MTSRFKRAKGTLNDFILGLRGQFPSLEEALTHPDSERKLIDLRDKSVTYDAGEHAVYYQDGGKQESLPLDPAFRKYMKKYAKDTHFVTDKGTPWLTRQQEYRNSIPQAQMDSYYSALTRGENREIVMLNWVNTSRMETGHAALSVGSLNLADGSLESDEVPIYDYEPEITGSYYGSTTPFLGAKHFNEYLTDSRARKGGEQNPMAHAAGTTLRDGAAPIGALVGGAMLTLITVLHKSKERGDSKRKQQALLKKGLTAISTMALTGAMSASAGLLTNSNGTLLMKEEMEGTGLLATLITPAQRDIMEHSLYGVYLTYHEKYNILSNNCADFASKMLQDISLDLDAVVQQTMQDEPQKKPIQRIREAGVIPKHIQPGRAEWALRHHTPLTGEVMLTGSPEGEQKKREGLGNNGRAARIMRKREAETGDEIVHASPIEVFGQSSILVRTTANDRQFRQPPIETFKGVLKQAVTLQRDNNNRYHFKLQPHIPLVEKEQGRGFAR